MEIKQFIEALVNATTEEEVIKLVQENKDFISNENNINSPQEPEPEPEQEPENDISAEIEKLKKDLEELKNQNNDLKESYKNAFYSSYKDEDNNVDSNQVQQKDDVLELTEEDIINL